MTTTCKFHPGCCVSTPAAIELLHTHYTLPADLLDRHCAGDWGELSADDREANERALQDGYRLFSAYVLDGNEARVWIITDAADKHGKRMATTIMLPEEY